MKRLGDPLNCVRTSRGKVSLRSRPPNESQKLVARGFAIAECAQHRAGDCARMLLFNPAHHHAEMPRLANHTNADGVDDGLNALGALLRSALLDLQPSLE